MTITNSETSLLAISDAKEVPRLPSEIPTPNKDEKHCIKCGFYKYCKKPFQPPAWIDKSGEVHLGIPPEEARPKEGWIVIVGDAPDQKADDAKDIREGESLYFLSQLTVKSLGLRGRVVYFPTLRCPPRRINEDNELVVAKPTKTDLKRCFDTYTSPLIHHLRPKGIIASGYLASNRILGRMDFQNLVGRTYNFAGSPAHAVWPVDFLLRDLQGQKKEYMEIWRTALKQVDNPEVEANWESIITYDLATTPEELKAWFKPVIQHHREARENGTTPTPVSWDVETSSLHIWLKGFYVGLVSYDHIPSQKNPLVVPLRYPQAEAIYKREHPEDPRSWEECRTAMEDFLEKIQTSSNIFKTGHNLQYDESCMHQQYGWYTKGFYQDTMLLNFLLHPEEKGLNSLDDMCRKLLPHIPHYWDRLREYREKHNIDNYMEIPEKVLFPYAAYDTRVTSLILAELEKLLDVEGYGGWYVRAMKPAKTPTYSLREYALHGRSVHHHLCTHLQRYGQHFDRDLVDHIHTHYDAQRKQWYNELAQDENLIRFETEHLGPNAGKSTDAYKLWKKWREAGMAEDMDAALHEAITTWRVKNALYKEEAKMWRHERTVWARENGGKEAWPQFPTPAPTPPEKVKIAAFKKAFKENYDLPEGPMPEHLRPRISWASNQQLRLFFLDFLKLPILKKTETGGPCLDADVLLKYTQSPHNNETAKKLLEWRGIDKFIVSFLDPIIYGSETEPNDRIVHDDGLIHCQFGSGDTSTGRLASKRPNMQAIPRDGLVKKIYNSRHGREGWIMTRDYSGLEVRVLALVSRDEALLHAFKTGGDPHFDITQKHFFGEQADAKNKTQRAICKRTLFGNIYGQGDKGLYDLLTAEGIISPKTGEPVTLEECSEFNNMLYDALPGVGKWVELAHAQGVTQHWACSPFGFVRPLPALKSYKAMKQKQTEMSWEQRQNSRRLRLLEMDIAKDLRRSQNMPIQSSASDLTVFAAYWINKQFTDQGLDTRVFNVIHDDIHCITEDVQVLKRDGWSTHRDLKIGDEILTKNPETENLEWQAITHKNHFPKTEVVYFKHKTIDVTCTPNHRWLAANRYNRSRVITMQQVEELSDTSARIHRTGKNSQKDAPYSDDFLTLSGWIITDGSMTQPKRGGPRGYICQTKKDVLSDMQDLIERNGWGTGNVSTEISGCSKIYLNAETGRNLSNILNTGFKTLSQEFIWSLSQRQATLVFDAAMQADGTIKGKSQILYVENEEEAASIQQLVIAMGGSSHAYARKGNTDHRTLANGRKIHTKNLGWIVHVYCSPYLTKGGRGRGRGRGRKSDTFLRGKEKVWCPTVDNGFFVARSNGFTFITGNSDIPNDEEVPEVSRIYHDTMDHVTDWLPELLPGYDTSWIDIPIIGEAELGVNPKDAYPVISEPTKYNLEAQLTLSVPLDDADSYDNIIAKNEEKESVIIPFIGNEKGIKEALILKRMIF